MFEKLFSEFLLNRFLFSFPLLLVERIDLGVEINILIESFGHVISRSCSRSFSIIFATITDGLACGGPEKLLKF